MDVEKIILDDLRYYKITVNEHHVFFHRIPYRATDDPPSELEEVITAFCIDNLPERGK